jgi:hypothetical protein
LTFATKNLQIFDWHIDDFNATGSDHELIKFNIRTKATELVENLASADFFNFKKADWKQFSEEIYKQSFYTDFSHLNSVHSNDQFDELNAAALSLQNMLYTAAEKSISKFKFTDKSKSWWSENLTKLRKIMSQKRRYWKNNQDFNAYMQYTQARNQYFHEIKLAKQSS